MTDEQFLTELRIRAYTDQIAGYPLGHPARENFEPIIPRALDTNEGPLNRKVTLEFPCYHNFTKEDHKLLLKVD